MPKTKTQEGSKQKTDGIYMYDRYKIEKEISEDGSWEYRIIGDDDLKPVDVYDSKEDAEEALKFWNQ